MSELKHSVIERLARFERDHCALLIACIAGLGTAHILARTSTYGAAIGTDSVAFLSTAMNFLAGEGWRSFAGWPPVGWPPLFPLLLTAFGWVGIDLLEAGRWINAAAFGLTILAAGRYLRSNVRSQWLALAATAIIAASLPLSDWAANYTTEPLFVLLTLLALIQLAAFLDRRTTAPLWWAAVFTALAALTRYPGVALIGTGVLILLPLARLRHTLAFGAISSVPLLAVLAFNWTTSKTLTGGRLTTSGQSLSVGLSQTGAVFHEWVVPPNAPNGAAYLLWLVVGLVVLAGVAAVVLRGRRPDPEAAPSSIGLRPVLPFGGFAVIYLVFIVAVVPLTVDQGIDSRYLLPIYVPLLLTAALLLDRFLSIATAGRMMAIRYGLVSLVLLSTLTHVGCSALKNLRLTARAYTAGYPAQAYNAAHWRHSETVKYLQYHHLEGKIYSNHKALAWFADRTVAPGKHQPLPGEIVYVDNEAGAHIVWFWEFYYRDRYDYDIMDLHVLPGLETVAELSDGVVFRITDAAAAERFDAKRQRARKERYQERYVQQLLEQSSERVVHSDWDVYRTGRKLTYLKKPCAPADTQAKFILHVTPVDPIDLPAHRKRHGFDSLGFYFDQRGFRLGYEGIKTTNQGGHLCIVAVQLPDYAIGRIRVGQWIAAGNRTLWEAEFAPGR